MSSSLIRPATTGVYDGAFPARARADADASVFLPRSNGPGIGRRRGAVLAWSSRQNRRPPFPTLAGVGASPVGWAGDRERSAAAGRPLAGLRWRLPLLHL